MLAEAATVQAADVAYTSLHLIRNNGGTWMLKKNLGAFVVTSFYEHSPCKNVKPEGIFFCSIVNPMDILQSFEVTPTVWPFASYGFLLEMLFSQRLTIHANFVSHLRQSWRRKSPPGRGLPLQMHASAKPVLERKYTDERDTVWTKLSAWHIPSFGILA